MSYSKDSIEYSYIDICAIDEIKKLYEDVYVNIKYEKKSSSISFGQKILLFRKFIMSLQKIEFINVQDYYFRAVKFLGKIYIVTKEGEILQGVKCRNDILEEFDSECDNYKFVIVNGEYVIHYNCVNHASEFEDYCNNDDDTSFDIYLDKGLYITNFINYVLILPTHIVSDTEKLKMIENENIFVSKSNYKMLIIKKII